MKVLALVGVLMLSACSTEEMIWSAFTARGATPEQVGEAIRVAECESSLRWDAVGAAGERGILQIHPVHRGRVEALGFSWDEMLMPWQNAVVAADLWAEQGWRPWVCARIVGAR